VIHLVRLSPSAIPSTWLAIQQELLPEKQPLPCQASPTLKAVVGDRRAKLSPYHRRANPTIISSATP